MDINTLIFGSSLIVLGGVLGAMYLRSIPKTSKVLRQKNEDLDNLNAYNKKELKSLRAQINSSHALPKVSGEPNDIEGVISALLPKITNRFPELKGLVSDGDIGAVIELAKQHPEIVSKILPKFLSSGKKNDEADLQSEFNDRSV